MSNFLFALRHFLFRLFLTLAVLLGLYNPTAYNYYAWVTAEPHNQGVGAKALVGVLILSALIYLAIATHKALGKIGLTLTAAVIAIAFGLMVKNVHAEWSSPGLVVAGQIALALLFAFGLSAANLNRQLSGQVTTLPARNFDAAMDAHHHHS